MLSSTYPGLPFLAFDLKAAVVVASMIAIGKQFK